MVTAENEKKYRFADFELDLGAQQLRSKGVPVHLERRPFELLSLLVSNHGRMVTREDVIRTLWPPNIVIDFDVGLNTLVRKVRRALNDSSHSPVFVETVARRGYRFIATVTELPTEPLPAAAMPAEEPEAAAEKPPHHEPVAKGAEFRSILRRAKDRMLFQWLIAYLAGAWVIMQMTEVLGERWGMTAAVGRAIDLTLILGTFVTLVLAWYHGEKGRQRVSGPELLIIAALVGLGGFSLSLVNHAENASGDAQQVLPEGVQPDSADVIDGGDTSLRIAVLPFENLTGDDRFSYMAAGLAEETSTSLAQIELPDLAVIGGVSARAIANSTLPLQKIGRELEVDFVVQSSLRAEQSRMRLTSRLIRVADGVQIWSASFDRELTNVLGLQRELSVAIAEQVRQRLSPDVAAAIDRRQTLNPAAYDLYLKGRYQWSQLSPVSLQQSQQFYEQAVATDPGYALAWAGIAEVLVTSLIAAEKPALSVIPEARDAMQRALELGPELAEVQAVRSAVHIWVDWDWARAEEAGRQAIALDSNSALGHTRLGIALSLSNKHLEALAVMRRARELDPLFALMFAVSADVATRAGEADLGLEFARQAIAINPQFWSAYNQLGYAQFALGNYEAALQAFATAERLSGGFAGLATSQAVVLIHLGRQDEARDILSRLKAQAIDRYVAPYNFAVIHAALGEAELAFAWLERALEVRDISLIVLLHEPAFKPLYSDPRFESFVGRCGFAEVAVNQR